MPREGSSAMPLLELDGVCKAYGRGQQCATALDDVSLQLEAGELVAVWGRRQSGRSTLLRVAAGVESPDRGTVEFCGRDVRDARGAALGGGIAYCRTTFPASEGRLVSDQLLSGQEAFGVPRALASARSLDALRLVEAAHCADLRTHELDNAEAVRVAIARALSLEPKLCVIDEPTIGVDLGARDSILYLLRSIADRDIAVLMSVGDTPCLSVADRALSISKGTVRGHLTPDVAAVVPLHPEAQPAA
jgi:ABC-type multidrug transport system ATPase subunit